MRFILWILLLSLSSFVHAKKCALYELSGTVVLTKAGMSLIVAKKTLSEKNLPVYFKLSNEFAPYVDRFVKGTFIIEDKNLVSGDQIIGIKSISDAVPDPLNQNQNTTSKKLKDEPCPKL